MRSKMGMLGKKIGMTQVFEGDGSRVGVTAVEVGPCLVVQKRTEETDGYTALQLGFDEKPERKSKRPEVGHFAKAGVPPQRHLQEFRVPAALVAEVELGHVLGADMFQVGDIVDISGKSKGHGFSGVIKRYGFHGAKATHGVHEAFRHGGSLGQNMTPARVMKGKKMPGHHGNRQITVQNVTVIRVFAQDNIIFLKGPVPGSRDTLLTILPAIKKS